MGAIISVVPPCAKTGTDGPVDAACAVQSCIDRPVCAGTDRPIIRPDYWALLNVVLEANHASKCTDRFLTKRPVVNL